MVELVFERLLMTLLLFDAWFCAKTIPVGERIQSDWYKYKVFILSLFIVSCTHIKQKDTRSDSFHLSKNKDIEITVIKPKSWYYMKGRDYVQGLKDIHLSDKQLKKDMIRETRLIITKHKPPYKDINPSIKVDQVPIDNMDHTQTEKIFKNKYRFIKEYLFKFLKL